MNANPFLLFAVDLLLKSSAILAFTWLTLQMWRHASAAQRGCIWCVAFALIALLPFTRLVAPHWALSFSKASAPVEPLPTVESSEATVMVPDEIVSAAPVRTWALPDGATLGMGVWLTGIFLLVAYRLAGAFLLYRSRCSSFSLQDDAGRNRAASIETEFGLTRPVDIRVSPNCRVPVTWGTWRPVVLLPAEAMNWPEEWLESALRHEIGHVKNFDHLKRLAAFLICAFYWPNLLVWVAAKQLRLAQEEASDNLVLRGGVSPQDYATQLIEIIRMTAGCGVLSIPAVAMARPSTLEGRLSAILDETRNRAGSDRRLVAVAVGLAVILGAALGAAQLRAEDSAAQISYVPNTTGVDQADFIQSLNTSILPNLDLKQVTVSDALEAIREASKKANPPGLELRWMIEPQTDEPRLTGKIDLKLENGTLKDAITLLAKEANLQYRITPLYAYYLDDDGSPELHPHITKVLCNLWLANSPEPMWSRVLVLSDGGVRVLHLHPAPTGDVKESLEKWGIQFPPGSFATCKPQKGQPGQYELELQNTGDQMAQVISLDMAASPEEWQGAPEKSGAVSPPPAKPTASSAILPLDQKLKSIVLSLDFNNATIEQAANFLAIESKRLDRDHQGVSFIIQPQASTSAKPITLTLANVSLGEALQYVCRLANVKFKVEDTAISLIASTQDTPILTDSESTDQPASESVRATASKLKSIIIPNVNFRKLDVARVLQFFAFKSKELDPDQKGINFVLGHITPQDNVHREVSLTLDNVPMNELLGYVTEQTNLKWSIEANTVYFAPVPSARTSH